MNSVVFVVLLLLAVTAAWAAWDVSHIVRITRRLRGLRVVTCPEIGHPAAVRIDVAHAVATGLVALSPDVRLKSCSRWAERGRCAEPCIQEAADSASGACEIVARATVGKSCVYCHKPIGDPAFLDHYTALLSGDGTTVEWPDVPPERLREALTTLPPVCWNCHIAETFRRLHPELVTDRPWAH
jgi:hypothetical protein